MASVEQHKPIEDVQLMIDEYFYMWTFPNLVNEFKNVYSRLTVIDVDQYQTTTSCRELEVKTKRPFDVHLSAKGKRKITFDKWKLECSLKHNNKYDYSLIDPTKYIKINDRLQIICPLHGEFTQQGNTHIRGHGCPKCSLRSVSLAQLQWLLWIEETNNIQLRHFFNGGEHTVPNTRMRVDGFDPITNTVYEFYGDAYHGNLNIYSPTELCSPRDKMKTAKELYDQTKYREIILKQTYSNVITIWESDWIAMVKSKEVILSISIENKIKDFLKVTPCDKLNLELKQYGFTITNSTLDWRGRGDFRCLFCNKTQNRLITGKVYNARKNNVHCLNNCNTIKKDSL